MHMPKEADPQHNPIQRGKQLHHQSLDEEAAGGLQWGKLVVRADQAARDAVMVMEAVPQVRSSLPSIRITTGNSHWPNFEPLPLL